jgi:plasmid stability protein
MPQLIVRNVDAELVRRLKLRAAQHGCSAEAEHRSILQAALMEPAQPAAGGSFKEALLAMPEVGEDSDFARVQDFGRDEPDLSD